VPYKPLEKIEELKISTLKIQQQLKHHLLTAKKWLFVDKSLLELQLGLNLWL
jgi:hypothetical protein